MKSPNNGILPFEERAVRVRRMLEDYSSGLPLNEVAGLHDVSPATVRKAVLDAGMTVRGSGVSKQKCKLCKEPLPWERAGRDCVACVEKCMELWREDTGRAG